MKVQTNQRMKSKGILVSQCKLREIHITPFQTIQMAHTNQTNSLREAFSRAYVINETSELLGQISPSSRTT
jgi:hypothetical protein